MTITEPALLPSPPGGDTGRQAECQRTAIRPLRSRRASCLVILPTYNESGNIGSMLTALLSVDPQLEVLVVDDASPDGTADIAMAYGAEHPGRVHVEVRPGKLGLGVAYRYGFAWATQRDYDLIVQMDADGSHPVHRLPAMLDAARADGTDVVVGSRYIGGGSTEGWPLRRRMLSRTANAYARLIVGVGVRDGTGGFRVWRREALAAISPDTSVINGYGFLVEMIVRAERSGLKVIETPITFSERTAGCSKMNRSIALEACRLLWSQRRRALRIRGASTPRLASA